MSDENEELLEHQTEADTDPGHVLHIDPVPVVVREPVVTVATVAQHITTETHVVSTADDDKGRVQLLAQDPLRVRATIIVHDQPVVICHSRTAAYARANMEAGTPHPVGAYVQANPDMPAAPIVVEGTQELWVVATWEAPARVSVISERRTP